MSNNHLTQFHASRQRPSFRLSVRSILVLVAIVALGLAGWTSYFDPVRRWKRAIHDDNNGTERWEAGTDGVNGQIPGVTSSMAIDELIEALGDPSFRVRETAARLLGRFDSKGDPAVPALIMALKDNYPHVRDAAAQSLGAILLVVPDRHDLVVPELTRSLKDPHFGTRMAAAMSLAYVGEAKVALPVFIEGLRQKDHYTRTLAIWGISKVGPAGKIAVPDLSRLVADCRTDSNPYQRLRAVEAAVVLISLDEEVEGRRVLGEMRKDADPAVRERSAKAWKTLGLKMIP